MHLGKSKQGCNDLIPIGYIENCILCRIEQWQTNKTYTYKLKNLAPGLHSFCINHITALPDLIHNYQQWFICTFDPSLDTAKVQENRVINPIVLDSLIIIKTHF